MFFVLEEEMFSPDPVQTTCQLCALKYHITDLRTLVKDIKNRTQHCKRKFLWIIFYLSMFRKFTYRLNPKYTKCQPVYILMPWHHHRVWIGFNAGAFFPLPLTNTLQLWGLKENLTGQRHAREVYELFGLCYELVRILMHVAWKTNEPPSGDI